MKKFTVLTGLLSVTLLALWGIFQARSEVQAAAPEKYDNTPSLVYDATGEMLKVIQAGDDYRASSAAGAEVNTAWPTVFDITGAAPGAINLERVDVTTKSVIVYDATGAMLDAISP